MAERVIIAELEIDTGDVIKEQKEIIKEQQELKKQIKESRGTTKEYSEENIRAASKLKVLTQQQSANQRIITGLTTAQKGNVKTVAESRIAVSALSAEWAKSAAAFGEQDKRTVKIQKELTKLNKGLKESESEWGNNTRNVGNYSEGVKDAVAQSGLMGGKLGVLSTGFVKLKGGLKAAKLGFTTLKGAIAATGIGLLVIAFTSLISWFKRTEKGAQTLRVITAALGQVMESIRDVASELGARLFEAFNSPGEAIKKLGDSIQDFVLERIRLTISGVKGLGKAFKALFEGEFKEAAEAAKDAFIDINLGLNPMAIIADKVIKTVKGGIEGLKEFTALTRTEIQAAIALQRRENELLVAKRAFQVEEVKLQQKILDLRDQSGDKLLSDQERVDALSEAEKVLLELSTKKTGLASEELAIQKERNALSDSNEEDLQAVTDLEVQLLNIENQRLSQQKALTAQQSALQKAIMDQAVADAEILAEQEKENLEIRNENRKLAEIADYENKRAIAEENSAIDFQLKAEALERDRQQEVEAAEKTGADINLINEKYAKFEIALEKQKQAAKLNLASGALGDIAQIFGKASKIGKAAAIAQTTIETYKAAQSSYAALAGIPVVGPALGALAAGAAIASGIAQVKKIKSVSLTGGSSSPTGGGGSSFSIPRPSGGGGGDTSVGASLGTSPSSAASSQANAIEQGVSQALANQPNVLVIEEYQKVEGRQTEIIEQSEL